MKFSLTFLYYIAMNEILGNKNLVQITQEQNYQNYSDVALENMYDYAAWRVEQLRHHNGVLHFLGSFGGELDELFNLADRIERVEKNKKKFEYKKQQILYEIIRRQNFNI